MSDEILMTQKVQLTQDYKNLRKDAKGIILYFSNNGCAILTNDSFCDEVPINILKPH